MNPKTPISSDELKRLFPHATPSFLAANANNGAVAARLPAAVDERGARHALAPQTRRTRPSRRRGGKRLKIRITVRAVQPCDWDNWSVKQVQDCIVHAGLLPGDAWDLLQGEVISEKVDSFDQEGTLIELIEQEP